MTGFESVVKKEKDVLKSLWLVTPGVAMMPSTADYS
jgi:hypothetical protein